MTTSSANDSERRAHRPVGPFFHKRLKAIRATVDARDVSSPQNISSTRLDAARTLAPSIGSLLHKFRSEADESAKMVSRRSGLGIVQITQLELGRSELNADEMADAINAYAVPRSIYPQNHCQVSVDLATGSITVDVVENAVEEASADRTLLTYLELAANAAPAAAIPFTSLDLDVLRIVLASRRDEVTEHLQRIVGPISVDESTTEPSAPTRHRVRGAALIAAAAATALSGFVVVRDATTSRQPPVAPIEVQIIDALVITREGI